jgi:hypothetical protein
LTVKDYFEWAVKGDHIDLYALIMFLVYEKKVLSFDDAKDKLVYYMQDKYQKAMNNHLAAYKNKLSIHYNPCVYEITTKLTDNTIYILAVNEKQATSFAFSQGYLPSDISVCDSDKLMTRFNKKNEEINLTIKQLKEQAQEIPSLLGGF